MNAALTARVSAMSPLTVADLIVVEETERGAAGARMHDGLVQDLLATRYLTDLALSAAAKGEDAEALRDRLEAIREAAALALAGSRRMMSELTARSTTGLGLAGAVRSTAASIKPSAIVATGDAEDADLGEVPPAIAVTIHRLAGALLRVCSAPAPRLVVRREDGGLILTLDAPVDLADEEVIDWVRRALLLGASVESGPITRAVFPSPPTRAPEGLS